MMKCPFAEKCRFGKSGQNRHGKYEFQHPPPACEKYLKDPESCKPIDLRGEIEAPLARQNAHHLGPLANSKITSNPNPTDKIEFVARPI